MNTIEDTQIEKIEDSLESSYSYSEYQLLIQKLLNDGQSTTKAGDESLVKYSELNLRRMKRWDKTFKIDPKLENIITDQVSKQIWMVISEGWCGDAAHCVPIINKITELNENIDLRMVLREENLNLMDDFLTKGSRSIPKLIIYDPITEKTRATWGPRPEGAADVFHTHKEEADYEVINIALQKWYNKDKGKSTAKEIVELLGQ